MSIFDKKMIEQAKRHLLRAEEDFAGMSKVDSPTLFSGIAAKHINELISNTHYYIRHAEGSLDEIERLREENADLKRALKIVVEKHIGNDTSPACRLHDRNVSVKEAIAAAKKKREG